MEQRLADLLSKAERLLDRVDQLLPVTPAETDWTAPAFRWRHRRDGNWLEAITRPDPITLDDLLGIDRQAGVVTRNLAQFLAGLPANDMLLWGSRGTGKSSLIKAALNRYHADGLRLVEVAKESLGDLPTIVDAVQQRPEKFLLYCDDLSFESDQPEYKSLKAVLDGSMDLHGDNVLICATSNRRHLMPEHHSDNADARIVDGELHFGEAVEEKVSLSDRFGIWLAFHPFGQDQYLRIVTHWIATLGASAQPEQYREEALRWALTRGSRSGRTARQFAVDWVGKYMQKP